PETESRVVDLRVVIAISDPRGISRVPDFTWAETDREWLPGTGTPLPGIHAPLDPGMLQTPRPLPFTLALHLHGTGRLFFTPLAADNHFRMESAWPHPSFTGEFLPMTHDVSGQGFTAEWRVNALSSDVREKLADTRSFDRLQKLGVRLIDPITPYPLT